VVAPLAISLACAGTPQPNLPIAESSGTYQIGSPDQLEVTILPEPRIANSVMVRPDGNITVEVIGDVTAAGRSTEELAADIEQRFSTMKPGARVTVALIAGRSRSITVVGEVGRPSTIEIDRDIRLFEALGLVGGPTAFANKSEVRIVREGEDTSEILIANLDAIEGGDLTTDILVRDGDRIVVPPTALAKFGYMMTALLFPFQPLISGATQAAGVINVVDEVRYGGDFRR
jgi:polysaccharide export outer membrane protein